MIKCSMIASIFADLVAIHKQIINFPTWSEIRSYIQHIWLFLRHICITLVPICQRHLLWIEKVNETLKSQKH